MFHLLPPSEKPFGTASPQCPNELSQFLSSHNLQLLVYAVVGLSSCAGSWHFPHPEIEKPLDEKVGTPVTGSIIRRKATLPKEQLSFDKETHIRGAFLTPSCLD